MAVGAVCQPIKFFGCVQPTVIRSLPRENASAMGAARATVAIRTCRGQLNAVMDFDEGKPVEIDATDLPGRE